MGQLYVCNCVCGSLRFFTPRRNYTLPYKVYYKYDINMIIRHHTVEFFFIHCQVGLCCSLDLIKQLWFF